MTCTFPPTSVDHLRLDAYRPWWIELSMNRSFNRSFMRWLTVNVPGAPGSGDPAGEAEPADSGTDREDAPAPMKGE